MRLSESITITEAAHALRAGECSVKNLVEDSLNRIKEQDGEIHAFLEVFEEAKKEAEEKDRILSDIKPESPLFGIPIAVKDNILVKGKRATAGSKILESYTAAYDATVVRKLKEAGAIIIGKTNLDEFAMGSSTENSAFGPTKNPYDSSRVPGGSSGGSAAAVRAGLALGSLGSDTGGSIRQPASFCGVVGMKPTYGRVSRHGLIAMASSLDQVGPFAKTVDDAEMLFSAIAGGDEFDATSVHRPYVRSGGGDTLEGVRIGVPKEYFGEGLDPAVRSTIERAITLCEENGAAVKKISLPHSSYALAAYYIVVPSEVSANLARFDGIRYGPSFVESAESLFDAYAKTRSKGFGPEVKRRIMLGTYALSAGYYDAYYVKAQKVRTLIARDFEEAFKNVDVIVGPTTPTVAFPFGSKKDPLSMYLADIYTVAVNLAGLPALSLPAGVCDDRGGRAMPVGLQVIAPWFREDTLFSISRAIEQIIGYSRQ